MAGINDSTFVHGVLDLIGQRLRSSASEVSEGEDPWAGTPSALLYRDHPDDEWILTSAELIYPSGYRVSIELNRGMTDEEIDKAIANNIDPTYVPITATGDPTDEVLDPFNLLSNEEQDPDAPIDFVEVGSHGSFEVEPTVPKEITRNHYDFEYYYKWRLRNVLIEKSDESEEILESFYIHMVYDTDSRLVAALVENVISENEV